MHNNRHFRYTWIALAAALVLAAGCRNDAAQSPADAAVDSLDASTILSGHTVMDVLRSDGHFSAFVAAIDSAQMTADLKGKGPYTVFAPTNSFFRVPSGDPAALRRGIGYYVAEGSFSRAQLATMPSMPTLSGAALRPDTVDGGVGFGTAPLAEDAIRVGNGFVYVLQGALVPPAAADTLGR